MPQATPQHTIQVQTTARLHMGFLDLNGALGRRFGSIGLCLDKPVTSLSATTAETFTAEGPGAQRVLELADKYARKLELAGGAHFNIDEQIPEHAGLGSGTQMAIAVGVALARLYRMDMPIGELASMGERGMRSGIGIGAFERGGLLVDGGRGANTRIPPVVARVDFPDEWRVILVLDPASRGVHGSQERQAFGKLPVFPQHLAAHIARLVLMRALPAVAECDLAVFGSAISELQHIVGDYFAAYQGGGRYASPNVAGALGWLESQGVGCLGQSSWGPTGFAIVGSEALAGTLVRELNARDPGLQYEVCRGRNQGGQIDIRPAGNLRAVATRN